MVYILLIHKHFFFLHTYIKVWVHFKLSLPPSVRGGSNQSQAVVTVLTNNQMLRQFETHSKALHLVFFHSFLLMLLKRNFFMADVGYIYKDLPYLNPNFAIEKLSTISTAKARINLNGA